MSQGKGSDGRMAMIAFLAVAILAISLHVLMSMEASLEEGRGPQGGAPFAILSLMFLIVALILLMLPQLRSGNGIFTTDNMRIAALMAAMFIIGMMIEPAIPRLGGASEDFFGAIFILIPVLLIAAMLLPMIPSGSDEEE
ncbi:MAG: hypothetical protein QF736_02255 [Candidatus Thalassarchaeaceae archaeon]|jgi:hypothetical protein|nr:hypothetical protein [Candidatus Thalassarchaeaceae archaeon]